MSLYALIFLIWFNRKTLLRNEKTHKMQKTFSVISLSLSVVFLLIGSISAHAQSFSNNGIAVGQLTDDIIRKYDQNQDSILDVAGDSFLRREMPNDPDDPDQQIVIKTESRGLLFTDADAAGNKDGRVARQELYELVKTFDEDGDAELTAYKNIFFSLFGGKSEWEKFNERYQEKYKYELKKK